MQYEPVRQVLLDLRYVGSRGVGLLGKVNLAHAARPARDAGQRLHRHPHSRGRLINPDFFVPAEFLGLSRNCGFQQLTNVGYSNYHALQASVARTLGARGQFNVAYTFSRTMDMLSSDRSLLEHDPSRPENNYGPSDFDRPHRLTTASSSTVPPAGARRLAAARASPTTGGCPASSPAVGHAVHRLGAATTMRTSPRSAACASASCRGGRGRCRQRTGPVQDRLDSYFDVTAFRDSGDAWGDTGRNILRGPSQIQLDSTQPRLPLFGRQRLELRWEVFNVLNTPVFANPTRRSPPTASATRAGSRRPSAVRARCSSRRATRSDADHGRPGPVRDRPDTPAHQLES